MESLCGNSNYVSIIIIPTNNYVTVFSFFIAFLIFFFLTLHLGPSLQSNREAHQDFHILDEVLIDSI